MAERKPIGSLQRVVDDTLRRIAHRDRYRRCPVCDGKQTVRRPDGFDQDCPRCKGEGEVPG